MKRMAAKPPDASTHVSQKRLADIPQRRRSQTLEEKKAEAAENVREMQEQFSDVIIPPKLILLANYLPL